MEAVFTEEIPDSWCYDREGSELGTKKQDGTKTYDILAKLVKAILCLAHGNGEVNRNLSEDKKLLTKERPLS